MTLFKNLWNYRELLKTNISKEIRGKNKGAWLGIVWSWLNPLLMLLVYSLIFPLILRIQIDNYALFLIIALIPWTFFTNAIQIGAGCIVNDANVLKKVYFPREILPISVVISGAITFLITCIILLFFIVFSSVGFSWHLVFFPIILIILVMFILGITFITSSVTVYVRDLEHLIQIAITVLFYATPIVYTIDMIPLEYQWVLGLNPMTHFIDAFRDIFYYHQMPNMEMMGILFIISFVLMVVGLFIFRKLEKRFAEDL